MIEFYILLFVTGLIGGFISGLLGVGGGLIYVLVLPIAFNFVGIPQSEIAQFTIANSLLGTFFAAALGTANHIKNKEFYLLPVIIISVSGIVSGILSLRFIVNTSFYSQKTFNIVIIGLLLVMLFLMLMNARKQTVFNEKRKYAESFFSLTGLSSGAIAALSGLGGGVIIIPFLNQLLKFNIRKAKSISLAVITITSFIMVGYNAFQSPMNEIPTDHVGYLVFEVIVPLILGALLSVSFGVKFSRKVSSARISYLFAAFIIIVMTKKILELV